MQCVASRVLFFQRLSCSSIHSIHSQAVSQYCSHEGCSVLVFPGTIFWSHSLRSVVAVQWRCAGFYGMGWAEEAGLHLHLSSRHKCWFACQLHDSQHFKLCKYSWVFAALFNHYSNLFMLGLGTNAHGRCACGHWRFVGISRVTLQNLGLRWSDGRVMNSDKRWQQGHIVPWFVHGWKPCALGWNACRNPFAWCRTKVS